MSKPLVLTTRDELARERPELGRVVLVPTMGALHVGHRSLITAARDLPGTDTVAVSVFVNPLQFGPGEDYGRYPRTLDSDVEVCAELGVDVVFAPNAAEIYPEERPVVTVSAGPMGSVLEGEFRPGFFDGVLTVVTKLFNVVAPDVAVFGEKDAQQLAMVRQLVRDLSLPVRIVSCPTVRDPDGLATSSRNVYLSAAQRRTALHLSRALRAGADASAAGPRAILDAARAELDTGLAADPPLSVDYLALVDPETFREVPPDFTGAAVLAVAAWVGETRLIDNVPLDL